MTTDTAARKTPLTDAAVKASADDGSGHPVSYADRFDSMTYFARSLEAQLARVQEHGKRDGNWLDKMGCCKVCDGEIPYGHTNECDIWKLEQRAERAEQDAAQMRAALTRIASFGEGDTVNSSFDEPGAAQIARDALNDSAIQSAAGEGK